MQREKISVNILKIGKDFLSKPCDIIQVLFNSQMSSFLYTVYIETNKSFAQK